MLNSRQRAQLRGLGNTLQPIFQIGKGDIGEHLIEQVMDALEARELVKISVLETSSLTTREAASELAEETEADVVQCIGRKFILYKESREHKQIMLVK